MAGHPKTYSPPLKGKGSKLTEKQQAFVDEFLVDHNGTKAVIRAGYQTKNPRNMAIELKAHPLVKAEIQRRLEKRSEKAELDAQYVLLKLQDIVEKTQEDNPQAALRGLELLGKHLGLYRDRQEISGPDGAAIEMEQRVREDVADFTRQLSRLAAERGATPVFELSDPDPES